jgi:hypothetical protein
MRDPASWKRNLVTRPVMAHGRARPGVRAMRAVIVNGAAGAEEFTHTIARGRTTGSSSENGESALIFRRLAERNAINYLSPRYASAVVAGRPPPRPAACRSRPKRPGPRPGPRSRRFSTCWRPTT